MTKPYIIVACNYRNSSAGARLQHILCHKLNECGQEAYVYIHRIRFTADLVNKDLNTPILVYDKKVLEGLNDRGVIIVSYTMIPFELSDIKNKVAYMMGWDPEPQCDIKFAWSESLARLYNIKNVLRIDLTEHDLFNTENISERVYNPIWVGKAQVSKKDLIDVKNAKLITAHDPPTREDMAKLFKQSIMLYNYDAYTATANEARLCGCPIMCIESKMFTIKDFKEHDESYEMNGCALNNSKEEIDRAYKTLPLFKDDYFKRFEKQEEQFLEFVKITQSI